MSDENALFGRDCSFSGQTFLWICYQYARNLVKSYLKQKCFEIRVIITCLQDIRSFVFMVRIHVRTLNDCQIYKTVGGEDYMRLMFNVLQRESQRADEYIRTIKDNLDLAVSQCIQAAGHEIEPSRQRELLKVSIPSKEFLLSQL